MAKTQQEFNETLFSPLENQARKVMSFVQYNKPKVPIGWSFILLGLTLYYVFATFVYNRDLHFAYIIVMILFAIIAGMHWFSYFNGTKLWNVLKEDLSQTSQDLVSKGKLLSENELRTLLLDKVKEVNKKK